MNELNDLNREKMRERLGNIDRIRDLLFGHEIEEYQKRFENCERRLARLETEFAKFQTETSDRLTHIHSDLSTEIRSAVDSLEKKLRYFSLTNQDETGKLDRELKSVSDRNTASINSLSQDIAAKTNFLRDELTQTQRTLQEDVRVLEERVFAELQQKFAELKDSKISRAELAESLFELCFKVKGVEQTVPELEEAAENATQAELLLPE